MDRFDAMRAFIRIVERRSFTLAAQDIGLPRSTICLGPITAANLRRAHAFVESGRAIGDLQMLGFEKDRHKLRFA